MLSADAGLLVVFSERECVRYMLLSVCLSVVCLSVTIVHPTQSVEIFGNVSTPFGTWPSTDTTENFMEIVPGEPLRRGS